MVRFHSRLPSAMLCSETDSKQLETELCNWLAGLGEGVTVECQVEEEIGGPRGGPLESYWDKCPQKETWESDCIGIITLFRDIMSGQLSSTHNSSKTTSHIKLPRVRGTFIMVPRHCQILEKAQNQPRTLLWQCHSECWVAPSLLLSTYAVVPHPFLGLSIPSSIAPAASPHNSLSWPPSLYWPLLPRNCSYLYLDSLLEQWSFI